MEDKGGEWKKVEEEENSKADDEHDGRPWLLNFLKVDISQNAESLLVS